MTKIHTTICIDEDLIKECKHLGFNVSGECNEFLKKRILTEKEDKDGITLEQINIALTKANNAKIKADLEVQSLLRQKEQMEEMMQKKKEDELRIQKEKIEAAKKCINCKGNLEDAEKKYAFNKGVVCRSCYMSYGASKLREWDKG